MSLVEDLNPRAVMGGNLPPRDLREILAEDHAQLRHDIETVASRANVAPKVLKTEVDLLAIGDIIKDARVVTKKASLARTAAKDPFLTAGRDVDAFFKGMTDRLDRMVVVLEERATDYQRAKVAEERRVREEQARKAREEEDRQRELAEAAAAKSQAGKSLRHDDRAQEAAENARRMESAARASAADLTRVRSESGTVATTRTSFKGEIVDVSKIDLEKLRPYLPLEALQKALNSAVRMGVRDCTGTRIFQDDKASFR